MADKQISQLTPATALTDGTLFVAEQSGDSKSVNFGLIKSYISPDNAPLFSTSASYAVNDYVIYNTNLYRFTAAKAAGAWDSSKVTQTTVGAELTALHTPSALAPVYSPSSTYPVGAYVFHDGTLYRCTTAITTAETWTAAHWTAAVLGDEITNIKTVMKSIATVAESPNLIDPSGIVIGERYSTSSGGYITDIIQDANWVRTGIIQYSTAESFSIRTNIPYNSQSAQKLQTYNADGLRKASVSASDDGNGYCEFSVPVSSNAPINRFTINMLSSGVVSGGNVIPLIATFSADWPGEYVPYGTQKALVGDVIVNWSNLSDYVKQQIGQGSGGITHNFIGKKIVGIGDSIMAGAAGAEGGILTALQTKFPTITVNNMGAGSTTFARNDNVPQNHLRKCITDRIDDIPADADYILLEGGLNDFFHADTYSIPFDSAVTYEDSIDQYPVNAKYTDGAYVSETKLREYGASSASKTLDITTFAGAFEIAIIKILARFYSKKFGFILVPYNGQPELKPYWKACIDICKKYSFPVLNLQEVSGMTRIYKIAFKSEGSAYTIDSVHPNMDGYNKCFIPQMIPWLDSL